MVQELLKGGELLTQIKTIKRISEHDVMKILRNILTGIEYMHS